jgi:hypothetical protein
VNRAKIETGHRQFVIDGAMANPLISKIVVENNQFQSALVKELINSTQPADRRQEGRDRQGPERGRSRPATSRARSIHHRMLEGSDFEIELLSSPRATTT